jgi:hypothetical protein
VEARSQEETVTAPLFVQEKLDRTSWSESVHATTVHYEWHYDHRQQRDERLQSNSSSRSRSMTHSGVAGQKQQDGAVVD